MTPGWRTDFLTQMGFVVADGVDDADVLIWRTESDEEQAALLADPTVAQLKATTQKRNVFTGKELAGAIAFASTLSYPLVADQLPPAHRPGAGLTPTNPHVPPAGLRMSG